MISGEDRLRCIVEAPTMEGLGGRGHFSYGVNSWNVMVWFYIFA
jgi:hypothetical protein